MGARLGVVAHSENWEGREGCWVAIEDAAARVTAWAKVVAGSEGVMAAVTEAATETCNLAHVVGTPEAVVARAAVGGLLELQATCRAQLKSDCHRL